AMRSIEREAPDLIFLDVLLPDEDGLSLLKKIKQSHPEIEVVMISGHATLSMAVEATRAGAYDFLEKPLQKEKILLLIRHFLEKETLQKQFRAMRQKQFDEYRMVGESPAIRLVEEQISRVAPTNSKVLILGESGTGKELVAWAIHHQSRRKNTPFVKMNCAAIPEELTESELFGHEKGAFTGAGETRDGKFLQADGGTLFLDEIADMSLKVQTKVLRVLQDGRFERVGGKTTLKSDVRVIAATNKNLERLVKEGKFREDLFYRLNVLPITVPPLRERREDIGLLLDYFVKKYCAENNRRPVHLEKQVVEVLQNYSWPGNIRELKNLVERLLIMTGAPEITVADLPKHLFQSDTVLEEAVPGSKTLKEVRELAEKQYILNCLRACGNNVSQTATMLGLERTNLHKKMKALGIKKKG
ncbi:MAG TPA: sigma-54-dependent Fis family transcriptional regulator, partial [Caldithrix sp.]|nr:sigma-54-dependent Fis family transcriptional regulator [Caldithrix sp.]